MDSKALKPTQEMEIRQLLYDMLMDREYGYPVLKLEQRKD